MRGGIGERELFGRDGELARIETSITGTGPGLRVLLLTGPAGIGKTALWEAGVAAAEECGRTVLQTRASESEARLSHGGLSDLLEHIDAKVVAGLPAPQRRAMETVLLWDDHGPVDPRALGAGFLTIVRALAAAGGMLIAVDDEQWMDAASIEAVTYALCRLQDERVTVLLTLRMERPDAPYGDGGFAPHLAGLRAEVSVMEVPPLAPAAIRRLVDHPLSARLSGRVYELSGGNPFFALEIARALRRGEPPIGSGDQLPVPSSLQALISARLAAASAGARRVVLVTALMSHPRLGPLRDVLTRDVLTRDVLTRDVLTRDVLTRDEPGPTGRDNDDLHDAVSGGLLVIQRDHVRLAHPLLGAVARAEAPSARCRQLHHLLAEMSVDVEERARHRALSAVPPDAAIADELAQAADATVDRGGVRAAAELSEQAWRFTPPSDPRRDARLLTTADRYVMAGLFDTGTALLTSRVATLRPGPLRARARLRIVQMGMTEPSPQQYEEILAEADPHLRAETLVQRANRGAYFGKIPVSQARRWMTEAVEISAGLDDPALSARCVTASGFMDALFGVDPEPRLARLDAGVLPELALHDQGGRVRALRALWRGEVAAAQQLLDGLLKLAQEREEEQSTAIFTLYSFEVAVRIGNWTVAARVGDDLIEKASALLPAAVGWHVRATVAAGVGDRALAAESLRLLEASATGPSPESMFWHHMEVRRAAGQAALFDGDAHSAVDLLSRVVADTVTGEYSDPGVFPAAPDLIEALAKAGRLHDARDALHRLERAAVEQRHPWALAGAGRARGILLSVPTAPDATPGAATKGEAALVDALDRYRDLGLPFDEARTVAALASLRRRQRRFREAQTLLHDAAEQFEHLGAVGLARTTRAEMTRVAGRVRQPGATGAGLTATEQQVVDLVAAGHTNRETAERLFVSVSAVEAHLTRIYAKLGVTSRTQLTRHRHVAE